MLRRVVVTGAGVVSPLGCGAESVWLNVLSSKSGIKKFELIENWNFGISVAAMVPLGDQVGEYNEKLYSSKSTAKCTQFALRAAELAIVTANFSNNSFNGNRFGVALGSGIGALEDVVEGSNMLAQSIKKLSPYFIPKVLVNMAAGNISLKYGLKGPCHSTVTACAASAHSIGDAYNFIRLGYADGMLAGIISRINVLICVVPA